MNFDTISLLSIWLALFQAEAIKDVRGLEFKKFNFQSAVLTQQVWATMRSSLSYFIRLMKSFMENLLRSRKILT